MKTAQSPLIAAFGTRMRQRREMLGLHKQVLAEAVGLSLTTIQQYENGQMPKGSHAVLDTPAGLHGWRLSDALKLADKIIVPLQASVFDIYATRDFLDQLASHRRAGHAQVGIVGMRVDERTRSAEQLHHFVDGLGLPVLGTLRDTQNYVHLAAHGLTVFDVTPGRVARDLEQWDPITAWLDA